MDSEKKVDEGWKEKAEKEKTGQQINQTDEETYHQPDFIFFLTTMSMQAMIALGKLENPLTKKIEKNLVQGRFIIDTLDMLKAKTEGNLNQNEKDILENAVSDLKMIYAQEAGV